jgi:hypothetical protein
MNRIWRYVLATDAGMAPCIDKNMLTLSCCKPMIRKHAIPGDWVVAFAPKQYGFGRVAYVGQIRRYSPSESMKSAFVAGETPFIEQNQGRWERNLCHSAKIITKMKKVVLETGAARMRSSSGLSGTGVAQAFLRKGKSRI